MPTRADDPATYNGWGKRAYNWEFSTSVQHEIVPRVAIDVGYFRRIFGNFVVQDNLATTAADYTEYSVTAPLDPRLPGGGGYTGERALRPQPEQGRPGQQPRDLRRQLREDTSSTGTAWTSRSTPGPPMESSLQGGVSTGRTSTDLCEVRAKIPELTVSRGLVGVPGSQPDLPVLQDRHELPDADEAARHVQRSQDRRAARRDVPEPARAAPRVRCRSSTTRPGREVARPAAVGWRRQHHVNVLEPGQYYVDRANMLDLRLRQDLPLRRAADRA